MPETMPGRGPVRAALVGCGDVSVVHLDALSSLDGVEIVALADADPTRLDHCMAARSNGTRPAGYRDLATLLREAEPDVVHITTPHAEHEAMAVAALEAGIDVVLEKPLASTLAGGDRIAAASRASTARLGVCFQNRYNASSRALAAVLDSGELGRILGVNAALRWYRPPEYFRARPWRGTWEGSGGGVLMNQAIHTLDLLLWLFGDAEKVAGAAGQRTLAGSIDVEDTADMSILHSSGVRSTFYATNSAALNFPVSLEVHAERGHIQLGDSLVITPDEGPARVIEETIPSGGGRSYWGASHAAFIADFYATRSSAEPFWIGPEEGLKPLRVIKEIYGQSFPAGHWQ